jgi:hypothetical protein
MVQNIYLKADDHSYGQDIPYFDWNGKFIAVFTTSRPQPIRFNPNLHILFI